MEVEGIKGGACRHFSLVDRRETSRASDFNATDGTIPVQRQRGWYGEVTIRDLRSSFDSRGAINSVALHPNQTDIISGT